MTDMPSTSSSTADDALAQRLQALAERRAASATSSSGPGQQTPPRKPGAGRRHPARQARYAAAGLSFASTVALSGFFVSTSLGAPHQISSASIVTPPTVSPMPTASASPEPSPGATAEPTPVTPPAAPVVVDGGAFHNRWGDVQVEVTFDPDGSIAEITALHTPGGRNQSIRINNYAVPRLIDESISVQSADVHTVSGATYTSNDYRRSLQSAIDAARDAGVTTLL